MGFGWRGGGAIHCLYHYFISDINDNTPHFSAIGLCSLVVCGAVN